MCMKIKKIKGNTFCIDTGMTYRPFYKINDEEIILLDSFLDFLKHIIKINAILN